MGRPGRIRTALAAVLAITAASLAGAPVTQAAPITQAAPAAQAKPVTQAAPIVQAKPVTQTAPIVQAKPITQTAPIPARAPATAPAPDFGIPVRLGNARQLITVAARSKTATTGTLRAWQKRKDGSWAVVIGPVKAYLGRAGIGPASEYASRTPRGTFTLTEAFGRLSDPGTALPYHVTGPYDWWVSDVRAASYNTLATCRPARCPFNTRVSERLRYITPYYDYAIVMDVNRSPVVPGRGSAFFLHVSVGEPTEGCVAIGRKTLVKILRWLDPAAHPRIATGIA